MIALSTMAFTAIAVAQSPPDAFEACATKTDPAARLACFDQEIQRRHASAAQEGGAVGGASGPSVRATEKADTAAGTGNNFGLQGSQLRKKLHEQGAVEPPKPPPLVARVAKAVRRPDHRYTLFLDNGQVWEQVEEEQGVYVEGQETVTISPGVLGSFFLETAKHKRFRVRRLK